MLVQPALIINIRHNVSHSRSKHTVSSCVVDPIIERFTAPQGVRIVKFQEVDATPGVDMAATVYFLVTVTPEWWNYLLSRNFRLRFFSLLARVPGPIWQHTILLNRVSPLLLKVVCTVLLVKDNCRLRKPVGLTVSIWPVGFLNLQSYP